jgi:hypothetical protein
MGTNRVRFWWPLELSPRVGKALDAFSEQMRLKFQRPNAEGILATDRLLAHAMLSHLADIIERDGLPHHCHIIVGWGDGRFDQKPLIEGMVPFIHRDAEDRPVILQCDPEGDYHPWQSLAYAVMAGVDPDRLLSKSGVSLRTLAKNSRIIHTGEGRELGHLLFALAYLDPHLDGQPFFLDGKHFFVSELVALAAEAHHFGTFEVCRKFHLTEGLCAVAALIPGLESYRSDAQGFLEGQMDMLLLLGLIFQEAGSLARAGRAPRNGELILELRDTLKLGNYLENHLFYAGHLIELSGFAQALGYQLAPEHHSAIGFVINEVNAILSDWLPYLSFPDCFLSLGHYRRALTLFLELSQATAENRALTRVDLRQYAVDFDHLPGREILVSKLGEAPPSQLGIYEVFVSESKMRPVFAEVIERYTARAKENFHPRGRFDHFRRIGPLAWPRALHYELLDHGHGIGAEIHLESDVVRPLSELLQQLYAKVTEVFPEERVLWDPSWYKNRGRLIIYFGEDRSPESVASGLSRLIQATFPELDTAVSRLRAS